VRAEYKAAYRAYEAAGPNGADEALRERLVQAELAMIAQAASDPAPPRLAWSHAISPCAPLAAAAFLIVLAAWVGFVRRRQRKRRARAGFRAQCGYDLRASPDRCPECGTEAMSNV
jgi:hypothetical protein